ncbi:MAG TPA: hypothetical protein VED63_06455 [Acidimicrobiales bacterium]|nr:hypothetical protein [Acidimicrobiales bacterium]
MTTILLTLSAAQSRHFQEYGVLVAALGGVALIVGAALGLRDENRSVGHGVVMAAGVLLVIGFVLQGYGLHRGF